MLHSFWDERWSTGQIGFHEGKPNDLLAAHVDRLGKPKRVLVPLAGKAFDLRWLADRGHDVVGVEFVQTAIDAFFAEWGVSATAHRLGGHEAFYANGVTMVRADIFDVTPATLGKFDAIYDRAALVALDPATRERYVATCNALLQAKGGTFLLSFAYDQQKADGPPWSVDLNTVSALFTGRSVERLEQRSLPTSTRFAAAGLTTIEESAYWITVI